jgi:hypothetical protein
VLLVAEVAVDDVALAAVVLATSNGLAVFWVTPVVVVVAAFDFDLVSACSASIAAVAAARAGSIVKFLIMPQRAA